MKVVPITTDWLAMMQRLRRQTDHAKRQRFLAASIDVADLELLLRELEDARA